MRCDDIEKLFMKFLNYCTIDPSNSLPIFPIFYLLPICCMNIHSGYKGQNKLRFPSNFYGFLEFNSRPVIATVGEHLFQIYYSSICFTIANQINSKYIFLISVYTYFLNVSGKSFKTPYHYT